MTVGEINFCLCLHQPILKHSLPQKDVQVLPTHNAWLQNEHTEPIFKLADAIYQWIDQLVVYRFAGAIGPNNECERAEERDDSSILGVETSNALYEHFVHGTHLGSPFSSLKQRKFLNTEFLNPN